MEPYHMMPTVRPPPPKELWGRLAEYGTATISSALREECGVTRAYAFGPACVVPGQRLVGLDRHQQVGPQYEGGLVVATELLAAGRCAASSGATSSSLPEPCPWLEHRPLTDPDP